MTEKILLSKRSEELQTFCPFVLLSLLDFLIRMQKLFLLGFMGCYYEKVISVYFTF